MHMRGRPLVGWITATKRTMRPAEPGIADAILDGQLVRRRRGCWPWKAEDHCSDSRAASCRKCFPGRASTRGAMLVGGVFLTALDFMRVTRWLHSEQAGDDLLRAIVGVGDEGLIDIVTDEGDHLVEQEPGGRGWTIPRPHGCAAATAKTEEAA